MLRPAIQHLAIAASTFLFTLAVSNSAVAALDLASSPPGTVEPYVAPNVIISIDDSGSMRREIGSTDNGSSRIKLPQSSDGSWNPKAQRINILKYALQSVFDPNFNPSGDPTRDSSDKGNRFYDPEIVGDNKIRLAWQAMWNAGKSDGVGPAIGYTFPGYGSTTYYSKAGASSVDGNGKKTAQFGINSMQYLGVTNSRSKTHRDEFLDFVRNLEPDVGTPSHKMMEMADNYMRQPLSENGPWASKPGKQGPPYLACRRNYHIFLTDGRWNGQATGGSQDNATNHKLPDGTVYGGNTAEQQKTALYRDKTSNTLSDWAFKSWAEPLQTTGLHKSTDKPLTDYVKATEPDTVYRHAPSTESFGTDFDGNQATLDRYWNPKYDPATWPHMNTFTIGFSYEATTWEGFQKTSGWGANKSCIRSKDSICPPSKTVPFGYDGSFPDLVTGAVSWPNLRPGDRDTYRGAGDRRSLDLWHAALNSRGAFYAVDSADDLEKAFRDILQKINVASEPQKTSTATSGFNVSRGNVAMYTGSYDPEKSWKGAVAAIPIKKPCPDDPDENADCPDDPVSGWEGKTTADRLDALSDTEIANRLVLSWNSNATEPGTGGVPFRWNALSDTQKANLGKQNASKPADDGNNIVNYIRGDRSLEGKEPSNYPDSTPFRERKSRQGDIVHSVVWYTGAPAGLLGQAGYSGFSKAFKEREPMLYVGGNDGMLHGFSAKDGTEKIAYVPQGVIAKLPLLTAPSYNNKHRYFVDGSPMTADVDIRANPESDPDWRTLLVGTLGAGGQGYFILDVTDPSAFSESQAASLVRLDRTFDTETARIKCDDLTEQELRICEENKDIGYITAQPVTSDIDPMRSTQVTRMNNDRWAVVMGNGYNSLNGDAVLLIQYLDGGQELVRIKTNSGPDDNGLSAPRLVDINGDGRVDVAYAGDNLGNMWKFDLTSKDPDEWEVAFGGDQLFTAQGPAQGSPNREKIQPITAAPSVRVNDRRMNIGTEEEPIYTRIGGLMVAFGTGRNVTETDPENIDVQTLYSVLDNTRYELDTEEQRLKIHPGQACNDDESTCVPVPEPQSLGSFSSANLVGRSINEFAGGDAGTIQATIELDEAAWASHNGWYMDFPSVGERLLKPMQFFDNSNLLAVYSQVPAKGSDIDPNIESCESISVDKERQWLTLINIVDGKSPSLPIFVSPAYELPPGDPPTNGGPPRISIEPGPHTLIRDSSADEGDPCRNLDVDAENNSIPMFCLPSRSFRPIWRQVQ